MVPLQISSQDVESLQQLLSPDERDRADRFRFEKDRREFIVARGSLRKILSDYVSDSPADLQFCYGLYGKPELLGAEVGGAIRFNVSHSSGLALVAVTKERDVGVDVEWEDRELESDSIAAGFFSSREVELLHAGSASERGRIFFGIWTRKEALAKAWGFGIGAALQRVDVANLSGAPEPPVIHDGKAYYVTQLEPAGGYLGAVALEGAPALVRWRQISL